MLDLHKAKYCHVVMPVCPCFGPSLVANRGAKRLHQNIGHILLVLNDFCKLHKFVTAKIIINSKFDMSGIFLESQVRIGHVV